MQSGQDIAFSKKNFKVVLAKNTALADKVAVLENQLREQSKAYEKALSAIQEKFQLTKEQLDWLRRQMYGRKTERFIPSIDPKQLQLELEGLLQDAPKQESTEEQTYKRKKGGKKPGQGRNQIPAHLERVVEEIVENDLPEGAVKIGEEVTETLEIQEGKVYVKRIVRPKYTYPEKDGVHIAPLPPQAIPKGMAGSSMLAFILSNKYVYHLPLYRSIQMLSRHKVVVPASTMSDWTASGSELLQPLYDLVVKMVKQSGYVQGDETTIRVLDEQKKGTHLGYYWAYGSPELNMVCFEYLKGRGREGPKTFLEAFRGTLQTDAWQAYDIFDNIEGVLHIGCMAHARRKFDESKNNDYARAKTALELIKKLYKVEAEAREAEMDAQARKAYRDKH
jgi:transposase